MTVMSITDMPQLKIISFAGSEGATKNMTVYECGSDILIVDCGVAFADEQLPGVDVVIPDFTYLLENREKVRGLVISHAHEDHLGAVPYLLRELNVPIYANELVQAFVKERLIDKNGGRRGRKSGEEDGVLHGASVENVSFHLFDADMPEIQLGNFKISAFRVNHSVPKSLGISINTPQGRVIHMADFKVDWNPVIDTPIDLATMAKYGKEGVLCLLSDCLGANTEGYSKPEMSMKDVFSELYAKAAGRQVLVTTISSNISRMYQIFDAAVKAGRKVVVTGRSMHQSVKIARNLKMLPFDDNLFIREEDSQKFPQSELVYLVAGCFGQSGSALDRISRAEHNNMILEHGAMVVFSADPSPPGTRVPVERMQDNLILQGAEVIYSKIQENLHVSGHGPKGDLTIAASVINPKYFIPIGGSVTQSRAYANMVTELGYPRENVFEMLEGHSVVFESGLGRFGDIIETKQVYVDGSLAGQVGAVVIRDREQLSTEGLFVVVIPVSKSEKRVVGGAEVITRGFIYVKESRELIGKSKDFVNKLLDKTAGDVANWGKVQNKIENEIQRFLQKQTGRRPMVIVHTINI